MIFLNAGLEWHACRGSEGGVRALSTTAAGSGAHLLGAQPRALLSLALAAACGGLQNDSDDSVWT